MSAPYRRTLIKIAYELHGPRAGSIITRLCRATCPQSVSRSTCVAAPTKAFFYRYSIFPANLTFLQSTLPGQRQEQAMGKGLYADGHQDGSSASPTTQTRWGPLSPNTQGAAWGQSGSKQSQAELCSLESTMQEQNLSLPSNLPAMTVDFF